MAKSYIAGEWEVVNTQASYDGLTKLMLVVLDNVPNGKVVQAGVDFSRLLTSWIGSGRLQHVLVLLGIIVLISVADKTRCIFVTRCTPHI